MSSSELEPTQWKILGDRLVDENPFIRLSIAAVGLPDGTEFEQYVMRMRRTVYRHEIPPVLTKGAAAIDKILKRATESA